MKETLYIYGGGGFAKEVFDYVVDGGYDDIKFVTRKPSKTDWIVKLTETNPNGGAAIIAVGDPYLRRAIYLDEVKIRMATIIHSRTFLGSDVSIASGCIICPHSTITSGVSLGQNVAVNINATIGHDTVVGSHSVISPGAHISGDVIIGECVYIGTGAVILEGAVISDGAIIGANAVVTKNKVVPYRETWVGVPAGKYQKHG